jgi:hypothetical protein
MPLLGVSLTITIYDTSKSCGLIINKTSIVQASHIITTCEYFYITGHWFDICEQGNTLPTNVRAGITLKPVASVVTILGA